MGCFCAALQMVHAALQSVHAALQSVYVICSLREGLIEQERGIEPTAIAHSGA